jgi:excisionase family DNA binding protein
MSSIRRTPDPEALLTPAETAAYFRVDPKTVTRWAKAGKLTSIRTLGGHRRYREAEVRALLAGVPVTPPAAVPADSSNCSGCGYPFGSEGHRNSHGNRAAA